MDEHKNISLSQLKEKTLTGFKWSFFDNVGRLGGQFVIGIVLARLLDPVDFGLVGMLTIFIVIGSSLTNSGFGQALIQKKDAGDVDFSTVFYFNVFTSIFLYILVFACSALISRFYNETDLISLTRVLCLIFIIDAFGLVHRTYLEKKLNFKAPSIIGVVSIFTSGAISIYLALKGLGVWALVCNSILRSFITTTLLWILSGWKPSFVFRFKSFKVLFSYGSKILIAGILNSIFNNIYYLIIGRFFQAASLGYYTRAVQFSNLPVNTLTVVVQKVAYPVFSLMQDNNPKLIVGYTKIIRILAAIALPLMALIYIIAKPIIIVVLGDKWLPVVPYLRIMCIYGWIFILYSINNIVITAKGRSDYYLQLQIINKIIIAGAIAITYKHGVSALIYGQMGATVLTYLASSWYLKKVIDISIGYQLKNILPFFISTILMFAASIPVSHLISSDIIRILCSTLWGIFIYTASLWMMKIGELETCIRFVKNNMKQFYIKAKL
ncbi:Membrane protein involved in the export of O-antigen and teichoic acid [Draconibacterium orientale]|uniref:Lipopolysaccharide biosynthesis protein n=1 Tax=Draconibacterium orientale TaxID=1168034 RepID=X5E0F8_9BACT|nr:lipopolysaccharide biosynthesis protein [Draconibacterium orientale]AHW60970.1 lipopolysaccharide biosynthesis protein [Draconibacterium orientale]SET86696.1 Membrane protein involved in the export of O-antigen and teichoic acid [Draconibacterium orientale]